MSSDDQKDNNTEKEIKVLKQAQVKRVIDLTEEEKKSGKWIILNRKQRRTMEARERRAKK